MSDNIGMFKTQRIGLQYAYNLKIGKKGRLAIGVQGAMISEEIDPTDVELEDASDPAFPTSSVKGSGFDLGAGLYYLHPLFWAGVSAQHINSPVLEVGERHEVEISPMPGGGSLGASPGWRIAFKIPALDQKLVRS